MDTAYEAKTGWPKDFAPGMILPTEMVRRTVYRADKAETYYLDKRSGHEYRRILGGIGWPALKPGFAVVVGELRMHDIRLNAYHLRVLAEVEEKGIAELLNWCVQQELNTPDVYWTWYAETENKPYMGWVYRTADKYQEQGRGPYMSVAPGPYIQHAKRFAFCVNILREKLERWRKTLHLGDKSKLPGYLVQLANEDVIKSKSEEWPAIAALGYAVGALTLWPDAGLVLPGSAELT